MLTVKAFTFNPVEENTYILYNEKRECCIIDPGFYFPEEKEEFEGFIEENSLQPILLLNTHCHLDHVFGNKFIHDKWGLLLHIHEKEKQMLELAPASGQMWQLPFGNDELEVRFAPGHSPGHVCFYDEADGFAISGDVLFSGSIGRTDLPGGDFQTLITSIQTQLFTLPDDTKIYCGHGPMTTIGFEKMNNPFVKLYQRSGYLPLHLC